MSLMFSLVGCDKENGINEEPKVESSISVAPNEKYFPAEGGSVSVIVTSTGDWTLAPKTSEIDWVTPDKTSGKNGDVVKFTAAANNDGEKEGVFVFTTSDVSTEFKVFSSPETYSIKLTSESQVSADYNSGKLYIDFEISDNINIYEVENSIEQEGQWISYIATMEGESKNTARMAFDYLENQTLSSREAKIQLKYKSAEPINVTFVQNAEPVLSIPQLVYNLTGDAGTLEIPVTANIEYEMTAENADWLTGYVCEENTHRWNYSSLSTGKREAVITFTEKNPSDAENPLKVSAKVVQSNSLINCAPYMKGHRAVLADDCKNLDVLKLGKNLTIELLLKHDVGFAERVGTILGIEERFLLRHGDAGGWSPRNIWEVTYALQGSRIYTEKVMNDEKMLLQEDKWMHIAVTVQYDESQGTGKIITYQDGEEISSKTFGSDFIDVDFSSTYLANNSVEQKFSLGWSYDDGRDFEGLMSEVRIWNKPLSQDEIKADGHFYSVPENSEGLVAYWKLNEGQGNIFKDYTKNGNNLKSQVYDNENMTWADGAEWKDVEISK